MQQVAAVKPDRSEEEKTKKPLPVWDSDEMKWGGCQDPFGETGTPHAIQQHERTAEAKDFKNDTLTKHFLSFPGLELLYTLDNNIKNETYTVCFVKAEFEHHIYDAT